MDVSVSSLMFKSVCLFHICMNWFVCSEVSYGPETWRFGELETKLVVSVNVGMNAAVCLWLLALQQTGDRPGCSLPFAQCMLGFTSASTENVWMNTFVLASGCSCVACGGGEGKQHGKAERGNKAYHQQTSFVTILTRRVETAALFKCSQQFPLSVQSRRHFDWLCED